MNMSAPNPDWAPRRNEDVVIVEKGESVILRHGDDPGGFNLNPSAFAIWNLCDGATTLQEMAEAIGELTSTTVDAALDDVAAAIEEFHRIGLVR
jgi:Coenzyme PQQ synthesis protein D (PqqD)